MYIIDTKITCSLSRVRVGIDRGTFIIAYIWKSTPAPPSIRNVGDTNNIETVMYIHIFACIYTSIL